MKDYIKAIAISISISLILIFIVSVLLNKTNLGENIIKISIIITCSLSLFISGFFIGNKRKEKGLLYGLLNGILYFIILYIISSVINKEFLMIGINSCILIFISLLLSIFGSIIGVNFS